jgi:hypothetical protein
VFGDYVSLSGLLLLLARTLPLPNKLTGRVVVVSLMVDNLVVFYQTADTTVNDTRLWPEDPKLWPTYVALGVAAVSTILATATLFAYFWGTKAANRWNMARVGVSIAMLVFTIVLWAIAAYGLQSTSSWNGAGSRSLWSATCDATDQQKNTFSEILNFHKFCLMQVSPLLSLSFWWLLTGG